MQLVYFAWVKTKIGLASETVTPPPEVRDVAGLLDWLATRGPGYADALARRDIVKVAINQRFARPEDPVSDGDEVALFPPVTGG